jgi:hypothetical protein
METNLYPTLVLRKNVQIMIVVLGFLQQQYRNINEIKKKCNCHSQGKYNFRKDYWIGSDCLRAKAHPIIQNQSSALVKN